MYQSCDLLVFCETWLNNKDDPNDYILEGFRPPFFYQPFDTNEHRPHAGMCVYMKDTHLSRDITVNSITINFVHFLEVKILSVIEYVKVLFIHRRPRLTTITQLKAAFTTQISKFRPDVIVGDINEDHGSDGLKSPSLLNFFLQHGFNLVTTSFTTISFTHIDVVYAKIRLNVSTLETVFSHHLPLFIEYDA